MVVVIVVVVVVVVVVVYYSSPLTGIVQIYTIVIIAVDRYICITRPMSSLKLNQSRAKICVALVWTVATIFGTFPLVGWNQYVPEG